MKAPPRSAGHLPGCAGTSAPGVLERPAGFRWRNQGNRYRWV